MDYCNFHDCPITMDDMTSQSSDRRRKSIRLPFFDYSQSGAYYITICTYTKECIFGNIINTEMRLNKKGLIVNNEWLKTGELRTNVILDEYIVMPNHFHGIIIIADNDEIIDDDRRGTACRARSQDIALPRSVNNDLGTARRAPTAQFGKPVADSLAIIIG